MTSLPPSIVVYGEGERAWHSQLCQLLHAQGYQLFKPASNPVSKLTLVERIERATFGRLFSRDTPIETKLPCVDSDQDIQPKLGLNLSGQSDTHAVPFPELGWLTPVLQTGEEDGTEDCLLYWQRKQSEPAQLIARGRARTFIYSWTENDRRAGSHLANLTADWVRKLFAEPTTHTAALQPPNKPKQRGWTGFIKLLVEVARRSYEQRFTHEQWHILYHPSPPLQRAQSDYARLIPPKDRFWADPFAVKHNGRTVLFVEELLFKENHGRLIALEVEGSQIVHQWPVLEFPFHTSYPFLVRHDNRLLMVPETAANKRVELYECTEFPDQWKPVRTLLEDCDGGDSSLLFKDGHWYLFVNVRRGADESYCNELHLFVADDLLTGEFIPHPASPVSRDCRTARMGGGFFEQDDVLFRVTQKGNGRIYGEALNLTRIDTLSPTAYDETYEASLPPQGMRGLIGAHHMSYHDGITAMDALRRIRK